MSVNGGPDGDRVVGADRVLAALVELAEHPGGITLEELATRLRSPKPTVHRALTALRRAKLAAQVSRGVYVLGDEFFRLAFKNHAARPESLRIEPLLQQLAHRYGETAHYGVLDGMEVVYRAKVDPPEGAVRLTSVIGGRNPAYRTAVGKMLMSYHVDDEADLRARLDGLPLVPKTPKSITTVPALWEELHRTRERGYAVDDEENEVGINCVAFPIALDPALPPMGAVSVSALAFRCPLERLIEEVPAMRAMAAEVLQPATG
jgi:IclR family transcriptional regulator, acetate operon repressor